VTVIENTLPFPPPPYDLNDNGMTFFPYEGQWQWMNDWPHVAEAWEKYADEGEHRKVMDFRTRVRCNVCAESIDSADRQRRIEGALSPADPKTVRQLSEFPARLARRHWDEHHRGKAITMSWTNPLWTWQLLGCADMWYGTPRGSYNLLDPRDQRVQRWEYDALELGTAAADYLWSDPR
jgi:hypothetical protein